MTQVQGYVENIVAELDEASDDLVEQRAILHGAIDDVLDVEKELDVSDGLLKEGAEVAARHVLHEATVVSHVLERSEGVDRVSLPCGGVSLAAAWVEGL